MATEYCRLAIICRYSIYCTVNKLNLYLYTGTFCTQYRCTVQVRYLYVTYYSLRTGTRTVLYVLSTAYLPSTQYGSSSNTVGTAGTRTYSYRKSTGIPVSRAHAHHITTLITSQHLINLKSKSSNLTYLTVSKIQ